MSWAESVRIETPEQIDFYLETAGPGSRFMAQMIDWLFKWLILAAMALVVLVIFALLTDGGPGDWSHTVELRFWAVMAGVAFVIFFGYDIYYEGYRNGQTPGKRRSGIRVVRDGGGPINVTAACVRNLVGLADFLPVFYALGGLVMLLNGRAQRLGDLAAGTIVIRERRDEAPDDVEPLVVDYASDEFAFSREELDRCEAGDLHILHSYFSRYSIMEREQRLQLAEKLCDIFLRKTRYRPEEPFGGRTEDRAFLASLYRDLKARRQHE